MDYLEHVAAATKSARELAEHLKSDATLLDSCEGVFERLRAFMESAIFRPDNEPLAITPLIELLYQLRDAYDADADLQDTSKPQLLKRHEIYLLLDYIDRRLDSDLNGLFAREAGPRFVRNYRRAKKEDWLRLLAQYLLIGSEMAEERRDVNVQKFQFFFSLFVAEYSAELDEQLAGTDSAVFRQCEQLAVAQSFLDNTLVDPQEMTSEAAREAAEFTALFLSVDVDSFREIVTTKGDFTAAFEAPRKLGLLEEIASKRSPNGKGRLGVVLRYLCARSALVHEILGKRYDIYFLDPQRRSTAIVFNHDPLDASLYLIGPRNVGKTAFLMRSEFELNGNDETVAKVENVYAQAKDKDLANKARKAWLKGEPSKTETELTIELTYRPEDFLRFKILDLTGEFVTDLQEIGAVGEHGFLKHLLDWRPPTAILVMLDREHLDKPKSGDALALARMIATIQGLMTAEEFANVLFVFLINKADSRIDSRCGDKAKALDILHDCSFRDGSTGLDLIVSGKGSHGVSVLDQLKAAKNCSREIAEHAAGAAFLEQDLESLEEIFGPPLDEAIEDELRSFRETARCAVVYTTCAASTSNGTETELFASGVKKLWEFFEKLAHSEQSRVNRADAVYRTFVQPLDDATRTGNELDRLAKEATETRSSQTLIECLRELIRLECAFIGIDQASELHRLRSEPMRESPRAVLKGIYPDAYKGFQVLRQQAWAPHEDKDNNPDPRYHHIWGSLFTGCELMDSPGKVGDGRLPAYVDIVSHLEEENLEEENRIEWLRRHAGVNVALPELASEDFQGRTSHCFYAPRLDLDAEKFEVLHKKQVFEDWKLQRDIWIQRIDERVKLLLAVEQGDKIRRCLNALRKLPLNAPLLEREQLLLNNATITEIAELVEHTVAELKKIEKARVNQHELYKAKDWRAALSGYFGKGLLFDEKKSKLQDKLSKYLAEHYRREERVTELRNILTGGKLGFSIQTLDSGDYLSWAEGFFKDASLALTELRNANWDMKEDLQPNAVALLRESEYKINCQVRPSAISDTQNLIVKYLYFLLDPWLIGSKRVGATTQPDKKVAHFKQQIAELSAAVNCAMASGPES